MTEENKGGGYFNGFLLGLAAGAAAVFFLGTKRGRHIAKEVGRQSQKSLEDLEELAKDIEVKGEQFVGKAKIVTQELQAKAKSASTDVAAAAKEQLTRIQKLQAKGKAAAERYFSKEK